MNKGPWLLYHTESRWRNSHVLVLSWPRTKPPFGSCAIYFHRSVLFLRGFMSLLTTLFLFHRDVFLLFMMGILSSNPTFFCGFPAGLLGSSWLVFVEGLDVSLAPWPFCWLCYSRKQPHQTHLVRRLARGWNWDENRVVSLFS